MSAKRELSTTLRNLKFMQRASPKQEKPIEEETEDDKKSKAVVRDFGATIVRKCKVITEGNPHPGALKGRMSFQGFNPEIDKLNQDFEESPKSAVPFSEKQNLESSTRSDNTKIIMEESDSLSNSNTMLEVDHKRKKPEVEATTLPSQISRSSSADRVGQFRSEKKQKDSQKQKKLDWTVLRREKSNSRQD